MFYFSYSPTLTKGKGIKIPESEDFLLVESRILGLIVRRSISADPGLNFNLGFFFFCLKAFYRIIFSLLFLGRQVFKL